MKVIEYGDVGEQPKFRLRCFKCKAILEYGLGDLWDHHGAFVTCPCCAAGNLHDNGVWVADPDDRKDHR